MSSMRDNADCAKWIDHSTGLSVVTTTVVAFPASNVAGISTLRADKQNFTRFVEVFNADTSNVIYCSVYNQGETARPATASSRGVPPLRSRRFRVPTGSGQGILSAIATGANCNCAVAWGIGVK